MTRTCWITRRAFVALILSYDTSFCYSIDDNFCRTNETHVAWRIHSVEDESLRRLQAECYFQTLNEAKSDSYDYLKEHVMAYERPLMGTLGFSKEKMPDGLSEGLVGPTIELALQAKRQFAFTDELPQHIFLDYVLNYANFNEPRNNWRSWLYKRLYTLVKDDDVTSIPLMVQKVNTVLWWNLTEQPIGFVSGQTPLILDPMAVILFGHGSCTGLSILFVDALRSMGIPARVAGTPAWNNTDSKGNHNWVEVYWKGWRFLEASPSAGMIDTLERDPCERWFCRPSRMNFTQFFAADPHGETHVPLPWEPDLRDVRGANVTEYYQRICAKCKD